MKAEEAKKLADQALKNLAAALQAGKSDALVAYLQALSRFHHYSFGNVMLIVMQKPDATHVAGFQTWKKLNRYVKKGEKGLVIIAPMMIKAKEEALPLEADREKLLLRFKAVYVFDVSQTDGESLPAVSRVGGNPNGCTDRLKALVAAKNVTIEYADDLGGPLGVSCGGLIKILRSLSPAEEFSLIAHELAHELLHRGERRTGLTKTVKETEAEAVAFVVCQAIGLETGTAAADYIQLYDGSEATLSESLDAIQQVAAEMIAAVHDEPGGQ